MAPKDVKAVSDALLIVVGSHGQQIDGVIEFIKQMDKRATAHEARIAQVEAALAALQSTAPAPDSGDAK